MKYLIILLMIIFLPQQSWALQLTSEAFQQGEEIPVDYTCYDRNVSPDLQWSQVPARTQSFALVVSDPDVPTGTWYHWIVYNIPASISHFDVEQKLSTVNALTLRNSFGQNGYDGPCPPQGTHHYFFTLYALDTLLSLDKNADQAQLMKAMQHHILESAQLVGVKPSTIRE